MTKRDKLMKKAESNPNGLRFSEFETLMEQQDWVLDRQKGSHRIWKSPQGTPLPVQEGKSGKAKGYQVKQFLSIMEDES